MKRRVNFVFPIAGAGSRFRENGFQPPKPLLKIHGRYFFEIAARNFGIDAHQDTLSFIVLKDHCDQFGINTKIKDVFPKAEIAVLDSPTSGAAETVHFGLGNLGPKGGALVVADCDQWLSGRKISAMFQGLMGGEFDIGIPYFNSINPSYSYLKHDESGKVREIVEKSPISLNAVAGCYGFQNVQIFEEIYLAISEWGVEKFMSRIIEQAIISNRHIQSFELEWHVPFGTPDEYREALVHEKLAGVINGW